VDKAIGDDKTVRTHGVLLTDTATMLLKATKRHISVEFKAKDENGKVSNLGEG